MRHISLGLDDYHICGIITRYEILCYSCWVIILEEKVKKQLVLQNWQKKLKL